MVDAKSSFLRWLIGLLPTHTHTALPSPHPSLKIETFAEVHTLCALSHSPTQPLVDFDLFPPFLFCEHIARDGFLV